MADLPRPTKYSKVGWNVKAHKALAAPTRPSRSAVSNRFFAQNESFSGSAARF